MTINKCIVTIYTHLKTSESDSKKRSLNYAEFLKKKKRPTYLPKLKLIGRSTANK